MPGTKTKEYNQVEGVGRGLLGIPAGILGSAIPVTVSNIYATNTLLGGERVPKNTRKSDRAMMSQIAKNHGYTYAGKGVEGGTKWHNPTTGRTMHLSNNKQSIFAGGPHYMPGTKSQEQMQNRWKSMTSKEIAKDIRDFHKQKEGVIRLGDTTKLRNTPVLAHEMGHHLQGKNWMRVNTFGKIPNRLAPVGMILTNLAEASGADPDTVDTVSKGIAGVGTLGGGLATAASEAHASWLGSKKLPFKSRLKAFVGVPTYLGHAMAPAAFYYGSKLLKDRFSNTLREED